MGIYLDSDVNHCNISNNNIPNNKYGIFLSYSNNYSTIAKNNASNNNQIDIYLNSSSGNNLTSNTVIDNGIGINLASSDDNLIYICDVDSGGQVNIMDVRLLMKHITDGTGHSLNCTC